MLSSNELGTFGGVFTSSILTILGVIMFMRAGFVIGQAEIPLTRRFSVSNPSHF